MAITYDQAGVTYDSTLYTYNGEPFSPSIFPVAGVYIAFTDGPYVASPAWTEVTTYVRGLSIHRGRSSDFDQFDTGTAQLVLDNRDRRFDPFYTSGPYYTKLTPRRQIRVVGQIGGSTYEVFRGYIAGWPVEWTDAGYDSTVTIQAFDALGLMANEIVPTDWPGYYTDTLQPRRYWKFDDSRTSRVVTDTGTRPQPLNFVPAGATETIFETNPLADGIVGNALSLVAAVIQTGNAPDVATSNATTDLTFSFMASISDIGENNFVYALNGMYLDVNYNNAAGTFRIDARNATNRAFIGYSLPAKSTPQHFLVTVAANAGSTPTITFYLNNTVMSATSTTTSATTTSAGEYAVTRYWQGIQEAALFTRILTTDERNTLYNLLTARLNETTTARMSRLIGTTDYPAALQGFTASPVATVSEIGTGTGVVPEMQLVADSEGGEIYVSKTGILTTTSRFDVFNATRSANSQATFTDSGVGLRYGTDLLIEYDADNLKNDVTVEFSGDGEVNAYSDAVIEAYGGAATTIETQLDSPTSAAQLATMELGVQGSLVPRISPIDVSVNTAAADWQTILGLELLDRVTFKRTPTVGNQFDRAALINAIDHQIEPGVWRTQLTLSMRYTSPETLDDDVLGTLDFNYLG